MIGPAWDENLDVAVSLDHVANDSNAHASPMRRASLIKNEGTTVEAEANESSRDMSRLRLRFLSRLVSCDCSTPPNPHPPIGGTLDPLHHKNSTKGYGKAGKGKSYVTSHCHNRLMEDCERFVPELPEIANLAKQMTKQLKGKRITGLDLTQPKCLNMSVKKFRRIVGKTAGETTAHGKWLFTKLQSDDNLLLNLGMGGDLLYHKNDTTLPKKYQLRLVFNDNTGLTATFSWFGYIHLASDKELPRHKMTSKLGISPIDKEFTVEKLASLLSGRRGAIKSFLLNQENVAGIGNVYVQDILFKARLHPLRMTQTLTESEIEALHRSTCEALNQSIRLGGLKYERDLHGRYGKYGPEHFLVAYKTGKPCPVCKTAIVKIRTGSTASYICPKCQKL